MRLSVTEIPFAYSQCLKIILFQSLDVKIVNDFQLKNVLRHWLLPKKDWADKHSFSSEGRDIGV